MLSIRLFGNAQFQLNGQSITPVNAGRASALFIFLVTSPQPQSRTYLADLLWDNVPEQQAKSNLRYALRDLRRQFGDYLDVTGETVAFRHDLPHWVDVTAFALYLSSVSTAEATTVEPSVLHEALELYTGEFLYGFGLENAAVFERWLQAKRRQLHDLFIHGLNLRIQQHLACGEYEDGLVLNQLLLTLEPWREEAHRQRMLLLAHSGQRNEALKQYTLCCQVLAEELDVPPMETTTRLYERIRSGEWFATHSTAHASSTESAFVNSFTVALPTADSGSRNGLPHAVPPKSNMQFDSGAMPDTAFFYGRKTELTTLHHWIGREHVRLIAILGTCGIGKSALTAVLTEEIAEADQEPGHNFARIIWRSLHDAPSCNELLREWLQQLGVEPSYLPALSFDQLTTRLFALLREQRCLLVLDGLDIIFAPASPGDPWFEERYRPGYAAYEQLLRLFFQRRHRSCLVLNSRIRPKALARLDERNGAFHCLELDGIAPSDTAELLAAHGVTMPGEASAHLHHIYGGSPLLLHQAADLIRDFFAGDAAMFMDEDLLFVGEIGAALARQLANLPALQQQIMQTLADAGRPLSAQALWIQLTPSPDKRSYFRASQDLCNLYFVRQDDSCLRLAAPFGDYLSSQDD